MRHVIDDIRQLRRRGRAWLLIQRTALIVAGAVAITLGLIGTDYLLRMAGGVRLVLLIAGTAGLLWVLTTYLLRAWTFKPSLTEVALRAERAMPQLSGQLASSIEFVDSGADGSNPLAARSVSEAEKRLAGQSLHQLMRPRRTLAAVGALALVAVVAVGLSAMTPTNIALGAKRVFVPLGDAAWPARTGVESRMIETLRNGVHPRGEALALRAQVTRGADDQRVEVNIRFQRDNEYQPWERLLLTHQTEGLHERLVDSQAEAVELYFATADARTPTERIEVVEPPAVHRASLAVTPPKYAAPYVNTLAADMGPGIDGRAVSAEASLIGSQVRFDLWLNKPVRTPPAGPSAVDQWLRSTFAWDDGDLPAFEIDPADPAHWTLQWTLDQSRDLNLHVVDQYNLGPAEPITYRILARDDAAPSATIIEPQADQVVLPTAVVALRGEAQDDVAIDTIGFVARLQPAVSDASAGENRPAPGHADDPAEMWRHVQTDVHQVIADVSADLDLSNYELNVGDQIIVNAIASDVYDLNGAKHEQVRSAPRKLQVISELDYATQVRRQLSGVRQNAIRVEALQSELQEDITDAGVQPGLEHAQAQLQQRIAEQRESLDRLEREVARNRLQDEQLAELLRQSGDLLDYAGRAASEATQAIQQRQAQQRSGQGQQRSGQAGQANLRNAADSSDQSQDARESEQQDAANRGDDQQQAGDQRSGDQRSGGQRSGSQQSGDQQSGDQSNEQQNDQQGDRSGTEQANDQAGEQADQQQPDDQAPMREAAPEDQPIVDAQQKVRDELADLIELLDRDEDTWVVTRRLEDLIEQQNRLEALTQQLSNETIGRSREELTEDQRSELDRIAERQRELADQVQQLTEDARNRAQALEDVDPNAAAGLRSAAETAEQREIDQDMEDAAQRAEQNQLQSARNAQQQASQSLERMLEDIEETKKAKAQQLLRQLASLIDSIKRLVIVQEDELIALARAVDANDFTDRDRAMIRLHQNTLGVEQEARAAGRDSRRIARALDRAADAQGAAVTALRQTPIDAEGAAMAENRSLELLKEALDLSEELEDQVQEDETRRRRDELLTAYRNAAEQEIIVRGEVIKLSADAPLNRRQLVEARRLGATQEDIRQALLTLRDATSEIMESPMFSHVHRTIDNWSRMVSESLSDGDVGIDVTDRQMRIADSIGRLVAVLEEAISPENEFVNDAQRQQDGQEGQEGQEGQGGEQGQQDPLIPSIAELGLLRGMQEQIYEQTRQLDGRSDLSGEQQQERLRELGSQQRELFDLGQELIKELTSGGGEGQGPPPGGRSQGPTT